MRGKRGKEGKVRGGKKAGEGKRKAVKKKKKNGEGRRRRKITSPQRLFLGSFIVCQLSFFSFSLEDYSRSSEFSPAHATHSAT